MVVMLIFVFLLCLGVYCRLRDLLLEKFIQGSNLTRTIASDFVKDYLILSEVFFAIIFAANPGA